MPDRADVTITNLLQNDVMLFAGLDRGERLGFKKLKSRDDFGAEWSLHDTHLQTYDEFGRFFSLGASLTTRTFTLASPWFSRADSKTPPILHLQDAL